MEALPAYILGILALFVLTAFVKIFTTLSLLSTGMGLRNLGFGVVIAALSCMLSIIIIEPLSQPLGGVRAMLSAPPDVLEKTFKPFLERHAHADLKENLSRMAERIAHPAPVGDTAIDPNAAPRAEVTPAKESSFSVLAASFLLSELREAFEVGFLLVLPFLVIDLVVANCLMLLGMVQLSPLVVSFPLKILLFFAVDGWNLVSQKLLSGYL